MARRKRRIRKRDIDKALLESIFVLEREWKQIQSIMEKSVETTEESLYMEHLAQAKYLFLLREAKRRQISALMYRKS
ncbi:MAG TPA: YaaL family protein [Bacillota bacterium]|nr:YaaL family protein [Bacillota bacterium]